MAILSETLFWEEFLRRIIPRPDIIYIEKAWHKRQLNLVLHTFDFVIIVKTLFDVYIIFMWICFINVPF